MNNKGTIRLNFNITKDEHERIKQLASEQGMTVSQYCRVLLKYPLAIHVGGEQYGKSNS